MALLHRLSDDRWERITAWVYGMGLIALFLISTVFHIIAWKKSHMRYACHRTASHWTLGVTSIFKWETESLQLLVHWNTGIGHPKIYSPSGCPRCRWVCFRFGEMQRYITCSAMNALQWMGAVRMMDLFLTNTQFFHINWWTGVVWIIVMFLSAVWTLILTAPIDE